MRTLLCWCVLLSCILANPALGQFAGGTGLINDPYLVESPQHLDNVRDYPDAHFLQTADIDLAESPWSIGQGWVPIGTDAQPFTGTYHGGTNIILNLSIDRPAEDHVGLFGYVNSPGWIRSLTLTNVAVVGSNSVGAVAGFYESSSESHEVHVQGSISGIGNYVGGFFGRFNGILRDSTADIMVEGLDHVAGMAGANMPYHSSFVLERCEVRGSVKGRDSVAGIMGARGQGSYLVNYAAVEGRNTVAGVLTSTYDRTLNYAANHGAITATGNTVGGVAASMATSGYGGSANYCYNFGHVSGSNTVGGILGYTSIGLTHAYNHGEVDGYGSVGGLIGFHYRGIYTPGTAIGFGYNAGAVAGTANVNAMIGARGRSGSYAHGTISRGYYDYQTSGVEDALGNRRSTAEMVQQVTFEYWNFDTIWSIGHDGQYTYPYMQWQGFNDMPYVDLTIPFASDVYVTGTDSAGETLTGHYIYHPNSAGDQEGATTFRWLCAEDQAGPFAAIAGATNQSYTLAANGDNKWYQFEITVWDVEDNAGAPVTAMLEFTQGDGTSEDPWLIANAVQLDRLRYYLGSTHSDKHFELVADIDLGVAPWNDDGGWEPIGYSAAEAFTGKLNGRGHVIRNLTINRPAVNYQGLFGFINGGEVVLLGIEHADVTGNRYVGALAGFMASGFSRYCYVQGAVEGAQDTGGFIGYNSSSTVQWSYSAAAVTGGVSNVGGFLGFGGAYESYWDVEVSGQETSGNGVGQTGLNTAKMQDQDSYAAWNFYSVWQIDENDYPMFQDIATRQHPQPLSLDDLAGAGTVENPYRIGNVHELNAMRLDLTNHYRLTNDIDMADTVVWNMARGWTPVGGTVSKFSGSLDGAGHTVSNLAIVRPGTTYQALFGYTENARLENITLARAYVIAGNYAAALTAFASGTEIRRIGIENLYLEGSAYAGGLAGYAQSGCDLEFVRVHGVIQGANDTGGLVGLVSGGTVHACETDVVVSGATYVGGLIGRVTGGAAVYHSRSAGEVTGGNQVGGLIGHFTTATMSDCFSSGSVTGDTNVGGLIGYMGATSSSATRARVYRSYSVGPVAGSTMIGGLVGAVSHAANNIVSDSYWDTETSEQSGSARGAGQDTATMQSEAGYPTFNFTLRWSIDEGNAYPELRDMSAYPQPQTVDLADLDGDGSAGHPYILLTLDHLNAMRQDVIAHYRLGADIDASATVAWDAGRGWTPIGESGSRFAGSLDGAGYDIRHLAINRPATTHQGLFAYAQNAVVQDLNLVNADLRGAQYTGGVIADASGTRVEFVNVQGVIRGDNDTGGLLGYVVGGFVHACRANVSVSGATAVGGLIGRAQGLATIYHSGSQGLVTGINQVGGLAGQLFAALASDCYSHADTQGNENVGGLIGYMAASAASSRVRVYRSYSVGTVSGSGAAGGLVGGVNAASHNIEADSYWDMDASGLTNSLRGTGKSTVEMQQQATFGIYNFDALWQIDEDNAYPEFRDLAAYALPAQITLDSLVGSGAEDDPYLITNLDELEAMRLGPTNHFRLAADIDAAATVVWEAGLGWTPIGPAAASSFQGSLNGAGHSISNLTVNRPLADDIGVFGYLFGAHISDLYLVNVNICGNSSVGGLAGQAAGGSVMDSVRVSGIVASHGVYAGGVAGRMSGGSLRKGVMDGVVDAKGNDAGGLIGQAFNSADIQSGYTVGRIHGVNNVGGLVGNHLSATLSNCFSRMNVQGNLSVGGAVGVNGGGTGNNGNIYQVYSAGAVSVSGAGGGGLLGVFTRGTVEDSYWDVDASGLTNSIRGEGRTTAEMTYPHNTNTTFIGWDFTDDWSSDITWINAGYPRIRNPLECFVVYRAGNGGAIVGDAVQIVLTGYDAAPVQAVPEAGAVYVSWSDGHPAAQRADNAVSNHFEVFARFHSQGGVPIEWYVDYGLAPGEQEDWSDLDNLDQFGKGMTLREEYIADTDPNDQNSVLRVQSLEQTGDGMLIGWQGGVLALQILEWTEDLNSNPIAWQPIFTNEPPTAVSVVTNLPSSAVKQGFYRITAERKKEKE